jgi:hypothetical protein
MLKIAYTSSVFIKLEKTTFGTHALFQTAFGSEAVHHANKISVLFKV